MMVVIMIINDVHTELLTGDGTFLSVNLERFRITQMTLSTKRNLNIVTITYVQHALGRG